MGPPETSLEKERGPGLESGHLIQILLPSVTSCVTCEKSLDFSEPVSSSVKEA